MLVLAAHGEGADLMPPEIGFAVKKQRLSGALAGAAIIGALFVATGASASTPMAPVATGSPSATQVRLVTGDIVVLRTDPTGRQTANVVSAHRHGVAGIFRSFNIGTDLFVVPQSAAPYFGRQLDPSLFDVSQLAKHPQASLHVNVTVRAGAPDVRLPGTTLRKVDATHAVAAFSATSAKSFGAALARQAHHDLSRGARSAGISPRSARSRAALEPRQRTLPARRPRTP